MSTTLDTAFSATTVRERDVRKSPIIAIGTKCPVQARIPKGPQLLSSTPEWERKTYDTPSTTGVVEGATPSESDYQNNLAQRKYLKTRFIKLWRNVRVTKEAKLMVNQFTVKGDPLTDNVTDKLIEINRDVEKFVTSDDEAVPPTDGSVASKSRGGLRWLSVDDSRFTDSDTTPTAAVRVSTDAVVGSKAAASDVTETDVRNMLTAVAIARQEDSTAFLGVCSPAMRNAFTGFSLTDKSGSSSTNFPLRRWNGKENEVSARVTRYNSDFGPIDLITSFLMGTNCHLWMMDLASWEIRYAQAPMVAPLPNDGASDKRMIDVIFALACLNPQANGKATTLSTT